MTTLFNRFNLVKQQILQAETFAKRPIGSVQLLAVSKTKPATDIASFYRMGQRHFGESYVQEALEKQKKLASYDITWHFIGPIQSNKSKLIAHHFNWVHSVDRLKIAKRLNDQRPDHISPLNLCLQVNISHESTKSGILLKDLPALIHEIEKFPRLKLRGVMAIPQPIDGFEAQRKPYQQLIQAVQQIKNVPLDTFSFGMTGDLQAAITEGSTIVRIGTALFGEREYPAHASKRAE